VGAALVQQWQSSGQTPAQFCRAQGVGAHRLHYWRRKLDGAGRPEPSLTGEFLALSAPVRAHGEEPARERSQIVIEIGATHPIRVRVPMAAGSAGFVQTLRGVLEALAS
jgi:hypothetical protein